MLNFFTSLNGADLTANLTPSLCHYLILSLILFAIGLVMVVSSGNFVKSVAGILITLNAVVLSFVSTSVFITNETSLSNSIERTNSTIASTFAPLENIIQNFNAPFGEVFGVFILFAGLIILISSAAFAFCMYNKLKNLNLGELAALKSDESRKESEF